ncbi:uncharacterized protein LOC128745236 [Sabethes cyaneus]|uniref:uncharacterized protein LOC128745236 n=1 Tax=Sabethes cyaneus TaxID=53552 RepID=UPI00237E2C2C|nr:uncharacterized protein LOC128745236 [Sabethes cyaneus]
MSSYVLRNRSVARDSTSSKVEESSTVKAKVTTGLNSMDVESEPYSGGEETIMMELVNGEASMDIVDGGDDTKADPLQQATANGAASSSKTLYNQKRNKVSGEWSRDNTSKLIRAVRSNVQLWNPAVAEYRNRSRRNDTWHQIAKSTFNGYYQASELAAKWTNLRIQFKAYHAKRGKAKLDPAEVSWYHYQTMLFITTAEDGQKPGSTVKVEKRQQDEPAHVHTNVKISPEKRSRQMTSESNERFDERLSVDMERSRQTIRESKDRSAERRPVTIERSGERMLLSSESNQRIEEGRYVAIDSVQAAIAKLNENDSYQVFGNYVAAELRKLPRRQANFIQRKLNRTLLDLLDANDSESPYPSEDGSLPASL